jgi:hypothetical protein
MHLQLSLDKPDQIGALVEIKAHSLSKLSMFIYGYNDACSGGVCRASYHRSRLIVIVFLETVFRQKQTRNLCFDPKGEAILHVLEKKCK